MKVPQVHELQSIQAAVGARRRQCDRRPAAAVRMGLRGDSPIGAISKGRQMGETRNPNVDKIHPDKKPGACAPGQGYDWQTSMLIVCRHWCW